MYESELENAYPGIGRLHYFLGQVGMIASAIFVVTVFGPESRVMAVLGLVLMVVSVVLDVMRLRNIGVSQWFVFLRFVPLGKALLGIGLLAAQPGWNETRRLDSSGKSILTAVAILWALFIFALLWMRVTLPGFEGVEVFGASIS